MNIILPPAFVSLLRNSTALFASVILSYGLAEGKGYLYGLYLIFLPLFFVPWIVMIATKWELWFSCFFVTLTWGIYALTVESFSFISPEKQRVEQIECWLIGLVLSLVETLPIYLWRCSLKRQRAESQ